MTAPVTAARTGGQLIAAQLARHGVDRVYCVPGESYLALLDGLYDWRDQLRVVACRQEGGAAFAAEAHGKLTGQPGVCMVTRGPGATNASIGVHVAAQDSTPMVLLVGQVPRAFRGREAFQELDVPAVFGPVAKWAANVDEAARVPELLRRAFHTAVSGRPGPVVLALPEDVQTESAVVEDGTPAAPITPAPSALDMERLRTLLGRARRPLLLVGGGGWTATGSADLRAFAEAHQLPVAVSFRSQDVIDNRSPSYVGHLGIGPDPALAARVRDADLLIVAGARLDEISTGGYELLPPPRPGPRLVHAFPDPGELGQLYETEVALVASPTPFAAAARRMPAATDPLWSSWTTAARADYLRTSDPAAPAAQPTTSNANEASDDGNDKYVDLRAVVGHLRERLPEDAIVTNGAGNFAIWLHRFYRYTTYRTQLAPAAGAMGYAVPAALAAKLAHPHRTVVAVCGDGDFLMTGQELATAVAQRAGIVVLVVDNGRYGTIRTHQERHYPGRPIATELVNPDFAAYARAFGAHGETVERTADFPAAFDRALTADGPAVVSLRTDPRVLTPTFTLEEGRG